MTEVSDEYMIRKQRQVGEMCFPRSSELSIPWDGGQRGIFRYIPT